MPFSDSDFIYGPVLVIRGKHKGRIGYLDNDTYHRGKLCGVVSFTEPLLTPFYQLIPISYLDLPNTQQLMRRYHELLEILSPYKKDESDPDLRVEALEELALVSGQLNDRMFQAQFERSPRGAKLFVSHSSVDKDFVRGLCVDLAARGHQPWLDEWEILAGESITERVGTGIEDADFMIVVLSEAAVRSKWVEQEWQAKHWSEVAERHVKVIPVLKDACEIPVLLRTKKYVDLRDDKYSEGLETLVKSLGALLTKRARI
jgi:TIR domain